VDRAGTNRCNRWRATARPTWKDPVQEFLQRLPRRAEFILVVGFVFGPLVLGSLGEAFHPSTPTPITADHLRSLLLYEPLLLLLVGAFLHLRGRRLSWLGAGPRLADLPLGLALAAATYLAYFLLWLPCSLLFDLGDAAARSAELVDRHIPGAVIVGCSLVNAVFEEVLVAGYVIATLRETRSAWFAVNVSAALRLAYHLYQGPVGLISVLPLGLIFGWWYVRSGRLWPLIAAHAMIDIFGLFMAGETIG
jgi:membrane protease YdiL (CAAX protease family)